MNARKTFRVVVSVCVLSLLSSSSQAADDVIEQNYVPVQVLIGGVFLPAVITMDKETVARQKARRDQRRAASQGAWSFVFRTHT